MEKLIELLNEREKELSPSMQVERTEFSVEINKWYLISKECWFIKRLIENNKIDFNKLEKIWHEETVYEYDWQYKKIVEYSNYETLLMLLAISDSPIDDLLLYLK